jgi:G3E family GTPase
VRTPVIVVTGVDPDAMATVMVGLLWDLPGAVTVQHRIDPESQVLLRVVSDMTGELDREEIPLEHACVSCALREDVMPTLERLARDGQWRTVVACLPVGAEATQVGHVVAADTRLARHLRLSSVITALDGGSVVDDLLGDDLLRERGRHTGPDDSRGVGEVACAMVEYADVVTLTTGADHAAVDLVKALGRPDALVVESSEHLAADQLVKPRHDYERTSEWTAQVFTAPLPETRSARVWRLDLSSPRPFHPARLLEDIERLGSGRHRSRGSFWLPTRPGAALVWDGAGGQLSIGDGTSWGRHAPRTRLVMTGVGAAPEKLLRAFDELVLSPNEALLDQAEWSVGEDGFEPWLGPIRHVA